MRRTNKLSALVACTVALSMLFAGIARADLVVNDIEAGGNDTFTVGASTTWQYKINAQRDSGEPNGPPTCNVSAGNPGTFAIGQPAGVTATPSTLTFTTCGHFQSVVFTASTAGSRQISFVQTTSIANIDVSGVHNDVLNVKPRAPSGLSATAGNEKVDLEWTASLDIASIDGYKVYEGGTLKTTTTAASASITGLTNGTEYCYTVTAYKASLESVATAQACDTPELTNTAPGAPGQPSLKSGSSTPNIGAFTLEWSASSDAEEDALTYALERKSSASAAVWQSVASGITATEYSFSSHPEGTWTYKVKASDGALEGDYSTASTAVKVDLSAPNAPTSSTTPAAPDYTAPNTTQWWKDSVTVNWASAGDVALADGSAGSGVASLTNTSETFNTSGMHTSTSKAVDAVGRESAQASQVVRVDATDPLLSFTSCPSKVLQGSTATVQFSASDADSGLQSVKQGSTTVTSPVALNTSTTGSKSLGLTAHDNVGKTKSETCNYTVVAYTAAFQQPIDGSGVINIAKLGRTVPVKLTVAENGTAVTPAMHETVFLAHSRVNCDANATQDAIESYSSGSVNVGNVMSWDSTAQRWTYNLDTRNISSTTGTCWLVTINVGGTVDSNGLATGGLEAAQFRMQLVK